MANFGQRPFMFDIDGYMKVRPMYSPLSRQPRCLRSPYLALRFISLGKAVSAGVGGRCRFPKARDLHVGDLQAQELPAAADADCNGALICCSKSVSNHTTQAQTPHEHHRMLTNRLRPRLHATSSPPQYHGAVVTAS